MNNEDGYLPPESILNVISIHGRFQKISIETFIVLNVIIIIIIGLETRYPEEVYNNNYLHTISLRSHLIYDGPFFSFSGYPDNMNLRI